MCAVCVCGINVLALDRMKRAIEECEQLPAYKCYDVSPHNIKREPEEAKRVREWRLAGIGRMNARKVEPLLSQGGRKRGRRIKPRNAASTTIKAKYVIIFAKNGNNLAFEMSGEAAKNSDWFLSLAANTCKIIAAIPAINPAHACACVCVPRT